jgi:sugar lactone lactonase YvrE
VDARGPHAAAARIAQVRFIYHGLGIQPPRKGVQRGKLHDPLFSRYALHTQVSQKASIGFHDGTVLHLNQETDAVIASPHLTHVVHGEVAEYLAPGSDHTVQAASATASAIGTTYDVRTTIGGSAIFVVLHGALQVRTPHGSVLVVSNHQTTVHPGARPTPPSPVDARAVFAWTDGIPTPDLGEDVSLDANGGTIEHVSSQIARPPAPGSVEHIHDGLLSQGWVSGSGSPSGQSVIVGFLGGSAYRIASVIIDPAATDGQPASADLKDFTIKVSTTDTRPASFTTILTGRCTQSASLQRFTFPVAVRAKYVELVANTNYGDPHHVAVAEWEVAATESLFAQPEGIALDSHNNLYVADTGSDRVLKLSSSGSLLRSWGSRGSAPSQFQNPAGVAVDKRGNIYVADTSNNRVQKLSPQGRFLTQWGGLGLNNGQLALPRGIAVDASGHVWVSDDYGRVQEFTSSGAFMRVLYTSGDDSASLTDASVPVELGGIAFAPNGTLVVADTSGDRIVILKTDGTIVRSFDVRRSTSPAADTGPIAVAVDHAGTIFATDSSTSQVVRINPTTGPTKLWGGYGEQRGMFYYPTGIVTSPSGLVYVVDGANSRIERFTTDGVFKGTWGKAGSVANTLAAPDGVAADSHGTIYVVDNVYNRLQVRSSGGSVEAVLGYSGRVKDQKGQALGQFYSPHGIAIDSQGAIYVADSLNSRIQILAPRGPIGQVGSEGTGPGRLELPEDVAIDRTGTIYVTDAFQNRIEKYSKSGKFLSQFGSFGSGTGQFNYPTGIAVDSHGNIYICDTDNNRLVKLSPSWQTLWTLGGNGVFGRFTRPSDVTVDSHDNVYVAAGPMKTVQKLSPSGTLLRSFRSPGPGGYAGWVTVAKNGRVYVSDPFFGEIYVFAGTGELLDIWN